jgi:hypothetical protein
MGFLLKAAFWLAVVVVLLPSPDKTTAVSQGAAPVQSGEAIGAAREFVADMGSFCERNREACDTGIAAAQQFGVKAQHGAKLLYHYIGEFTGDRDPALAMSQSPVGSAAPTHTATHTSGVSGASRADRIGTLTQQDLLLAPQGNANAAMQVQPVQTIRIPVTQNGAFAPAQRPVQSLGQNTAEAIAPAGHGVTWQADPIGSMANTAWRAPLTRAELAAQPDARPASQDVIGGLIGQTN